MTKEIFLPGFDQHMVEKVISSMEIMGINLLRNSMAKKVIQDSRGCKIVEYCVNGEQQKTEEFNTVVFAIEKITDIENMGIK